MPLHEEEHPLSHVTSRSSTNVTNLCNDQRHVWRWLRIHGEKNSHRPKDNKRGKVPTKYPYSHSRLIIRSWGGCQTQVIWFGLGHECGLISALFFFFSSRFQVCLQGRVIVVWGTSSARPSTANVSWLPGLFLTVLP